jgi:hypothetical protein
MNLWCSFGILICFWAWVWKRWSISRLASMTLLCKWKRKMSAIYYQQFAEFVILLMILPAFQWRGKWGTGLVQSWTTQCEHRIYSWCLHKLWEHPLPRIDHYFRDRCVLRMECGRHLSPYWIQYASFATICYWRRGNLGQMLDPSWGLRGWVEGQETLHRTCSTQTIIILFYYPELKRKFFNTETYIINL